MTGACRRLPFISRQESCSKVKKRILRRLISLSTTLLAGVVLLFLILNLAPRRTVGVTGEAMQRYRHHFGLDLPLLVNLRFTVSKSDVAAWLSALQVPDRKEMAEQNLHDHGDWLILPLLDLWQDESRPAQKKLLVEKIIHFIDSSHDQTLVQGRRALVDLLGADATAVKSLLTQWRQTYARSLSPSIGRKILVALGETRFARFFLGLLSGDLGTSMRDGRPVLPRAVSATGVSLLIVGCAIALALLVAIPLGAVLARVRPVTARLVGRIVYIIYALPAFFLGTLLLRFLARGGSGLQWFPNGGLQCSSALSGGALASVQELLAHLALPVLTLALPLTAMFLHHIRDGVREALASSHVIAARARGVPPRQILVRHAVVNGCIPLLTEAGSTLPVLLGGAMVVEYIFNLPGAGMLALDAVRAGDIVEVSGIQAVVATVVLVGVAMADLACALADPRGLES